MKGMEMNKKCNLSFAPESNIESIYASLNKLGLSNFVMCIAFNNGQTFMLSKQGNKDVEIDERMDESTETYLEYPICNDEGELSNELLSIFEEKYNYRPNHFLIRKHSECSFVFCAARNISSNNVMPFFKYDENAFQEFCITFVDKFLPLIIESNPIYKFSLIFTNKALRDLVIRNEFNREIHLSARERQCLILISQGNKTKEIAKILNISPYTVEDHLKKIRKEFQCKTMLEVVVEAMQRGLIGGFTQFNPLGARHIISWPQAGQFNVIKAIKTELQPPLKLKA